jgi:uncharacterized protein YbaA (DUF1428 family)
MPKYVDGFIIPVPRARLDEYKKMARKASKIWLKYGALDYCETVGDDLEVMGMTSFNKLAKTKDDELVIFAWITYASKKERNQINKKVMQDPWILKMDPAMHPFSPKRMAFGGFKVFVDSGQLD